MHYDTSTDSEQRWTVNLGRAANNLLPGRYKLWHTDSYTETTGNCQADNGNIIGEVGDIIDEGCFSRHNIMTPFSFSDGSGFTVTQHSELKKYINWEYLEPHQSFHFGKPPSASPAPVIETTVSLAPLVTTTPNR